MITLTTTRIREELSTVVNEVAHGKQRAILRRHGKDVAAIIPIEDLRLLERLERELEDRLDVAEAEEILDGLKENELQSWKVVKERMD